jgi:hypothetical protein
MRKVPPAVGLAAALLALFGCGHAGRSASPQGSQAAGPRPRETVASATAAPASATPSPTALPSAKPLSARLAKVARLPPAAPPRILDVAVSETSVAPGDRVFGRVVTSSNVASVQARIGGYSATLVKVGVGRFELNYRVGPLPWFVHGNFTLKVIARNTAGDTVTRELPLTVR